MFQWRRTRIADEGVLLTDSVFEKRVKFLEPENRLLKQDLNRYKVLYDRLCDEFNAQTGNFLHISEKQREVTQRCVAEKQQCEAELKSLHTRVQLLEEHASAIEQRCDNKILELHEKMQLAEHLLSRVQKVDGFLEQISNMDCPICVQPMMNPIGLKCGHVFEASAICDWFDAKPSCPVCRCKLSQGERLFSRPGVLNKILTLVAKMKESRDVFRTVYLWDCIKAEFTLDDRNTMMEDPVLVPCGSLMDRRMLGVYDCLGCDAEHGTFQAMPSFLQSVWELVKEG